MVHLYYMSCPPHSSFPERRDPHQTVFHILVWWSGIRKIADAIPTLHWRPDDRLTEGVPRFRVYSLPHLVYPSVGRVALFSVDLSRC